MSAYCLPNRVIYASISHLLRCISRGTQPKEKEHYTSTHTYSHGGRLAGRYSNHLWQLLNHLIFLRLFFFFFPQMRNSELCNLGPSGDGWRQGQHKTNMRGFPAAAQKALVNVAGNEILSQCIKQSNPSEPWNGPSQLRDVAALCVHRGSPGRSDGPSSESAKSILAAGGIYLQSQVTSFSLSSFDCRLRSYCRKQRDGDGGAGIMNINELNSPVCSWSSAGRTQRRLKKNKSKLMLQNA